MQNCLGYGVGKANEVAAAIANYSQRAFTTKESESLRAMGSGVTMKPLVLICTEDIDFFLLLDHVLETEEFRCMLATNHDEILKAVVEEIPGVVVLDCKPQSFSATDVFNHLKNKPETASTPVVALVDHGAETDYVRLLKSGIDDAFTKPVSPASLIERIRTILKGEHRAALSGSDALQYADIEMNLNSRRVRRNGKEIHLGPIEYKLLQHLLKSPEQVFSRDELIGAVWPSNVYVEPRTVDVHVGKLRKALKSVAPRDLIRTVRAVGYALTDQTDDAPLMDIPPQDGVTRPE